MKLNLKKMKTNQVVILISLIVVITWMVMRSKRSEHNEGEKSDALLYVENTETPNPFILYGMVRKQTDDEEKHKKALTLATEKKYDELKEFLVTI